MIDKVEIHSRVIIGRDKQRKNNNRQSKQSVHLGVSIVLHTFNKMNNQFNLNNKYYINNLAEPNPIC